LPPSPRHARFDNAGSPTRSTPPAAEASLPANNASGHAARIYVKNGITRSTPRAIDNTTITVFRREHADDHTAQATPATLTKEEPAP
jgi:hypothetical protein